MNEFGGNSSLLRPTTTTQYTSTYRERRKGAHAQLMGMVILINWGDQTDQTDVKYKCGIERTRTGGEVIRLTDERFTPSSLLVDSRAEQSGAELRAGRER